MATYPNIYPRALIEGGGGGDGEAQLDDFLQAGTGAATRTIQSKLRERVSLEDFGAYGDADGMSPHDDTSAITYAATLAANIGAILCAKPGAKYKITSGVVFQSPVDMSNSEFWVYNDPAIAVDFCIGDGDGYPTLFFCQEFNLPRVINKDKIPEGGWSGAGVGVRLHNFLGCTVRAPYIRGFDEGLLCTAENTGFVYNDICIGQLDTNKYNLVGRALSGGWVNSNKFHSGSLRFDSGEGERVSGTRHILFDVGDGSPPNCNTCYAIAMEGDVAEYYIEMLCANYSLFDFCRYESTNVVPRVYMNDTGSPGTARDNWFRQGYNLSEVEFISTGTAGNIHVQTELGNIRQILSNGGNGYADSGSSDNPVFRLWDAGQNPAEKASSATDWSSFWSAREISGKQTGDTVARIALKFANGYLELGNGSAVRAQLRSYPDGFYSPQSLWLDGYLSTSRVSLNDGNSELVTWTKGTGAPTTTAPNGSLYSRTDGTGPNLYVRENDVWVAK